MRPFIAALLALALLLPVRAEPAALVVSTSYQADQALVVSWSPVDGEQLGCVLRAGLLIDCADPGAHQVVQGPGSVDAALRLRPGDRIEVRVWDEEGELLAKGETWVGWRVTLPLVRR